MFWIIDQLEDTNNAFLIRLDTEIFLYVPPELLPEHMYQKINNSEQYLCLNKIR